MDSLSKREWYRVTVETEDGELPTLLDTTSFLYDFNLVYEIARLAADPRYKSFEFSRYLYFRKGRPLVDADRLSVQRLTQQSPLQLTAVVLATPAALGALWLVVQIFEKTTNFRLNRRKLRAEVEKLERENKEAARKKTKDGDSVVDEEELLSRARERGAEEYLESVGRRIAQGKIRIRTLDIEVSVTNERQEGR